MSDHLLFIDESGDSSLKTINEDFPVFALMGVLISRYEYSEICFAMDRLKERFFGTKRVVLHSRDISR